MHPFTKIVLGVFTSSSLLLTGCQQYHKPQQIVTTTPEQSATQPVQETNFALQGKIGVRTPKQSGSAFFTWQQQQDNFDIELSGALGIGKTHIEGTQGQVTLNSAKTGLIHATKGRDGGIALGKNPSEITIAHILEAMNEPTHECRCILGFATCNPDNPCLLHHSWEKPRALIDTMIHKTTLEDLLLQRTPSL